MKKISIYSRKYILLILLTIPILAEGIGINGLRDLLPLPLFILPFLIFKNANQEKKKIFVPKTLAMLFLLFITFTLLSTIGSGNVKVSLEYSFFYITLALIFTFAYNNQKKLDSQVTNILLYVSIVFSLASFFIYSKALPFIGNFVPENGYQFVYASFGSHNHLGIFAAIGIIILLYKLSSKITAGLILSSLILFPSFISSFSRSAYMALIFGVGFFFFFLLKQKKSYRIPKLLGSLLILTSFMLFFVVTNGSFVKRIENIINQNLFLEEKTFIAKRDVYLQDALFSFVNKPILGIGPGNFNHATQRYIGISLENTDSSHNLFMDIIVENGIIAGYLFIAMIFLLFKNSRMGVIYIIAFSMLVNFQTDYTYRIFSFMILFIFLLGLTYKDKNNFDFTKFAFPLSLILLVFSFFVTTSLVVTNINPKLSLILYPLNQKAYQQIIDSHQGKSEHLIPITNIYAYIFSSEPDALRRAANLNESFSNESHALSLFEQSYRSAPLQRPGVIAKIYSLKIESGNTKGANEFMEEVFYQLSNLEDKNTANFESRIEAMKICQEIYNLKCPYSL